MLSELVGKSYPLRELERQLSNGAWGRLRLFPIARAYSSQTLKG